MTDGDPPALHNRASLDALEPALRAAVDAIESLAKSLQDVSLPPSEAVRLAEAVSTARNGLYRELARQGWTPPASVPPGMALDDQLRQEPLSSTYDEDPELSE